MSALKKKGKIKIINKGDYISIKAIINSNLVKKNIHRGESTLYRKLYTSLSRGAIFLYVLKLETVKFLLT